MKTRERTNSRQPSLYTVLNKITPNVPRDVCVFRYDLTRLLLSMRVPLSVVNKEITRDFISNHVGAATKWVTDRSNLAKEYIPAIVEIHHNETSEIFKDNLCSIQVDSTFRMGSWYGFIFRCVTDELEIITRPKLVRVARSLKEADGIEELSSLVISTVRDMIDYHRLRFNGALGAHIHACEKIKCISGDRISINRCAFMNRDVYQAFPKMIYLDCHPHTFAKCGEKIDLACTELHRFWINHTAVFARSENNVELWERHSNVAMKRHNNTRWFGKRDAMEFVMLRWIQYVNFYRLLEHDLKRDNSTVIKLRSILWPDPDNAATYEQAKDRLFNIRMELAIVCESSKIYYAACYNLEGTVKIYIIYINYIEYIFLQNFNNF